MQHFTWIHVIIDCYCSYICYGIMSVCHSVIVHHQEWIGLRINRAWCHKNVGGYSTTQVVFKLPIIRFMYLVGTTVFTTTVHTWEVSGVPQPGHHTKFCTLFKKILLMSCTACIDIRNVLNSKFSNIAVFTCYMTHFTILTLLG